MPHDTGFGFKLREDRKISNAHDKNYNVFYLEIPQPFQVDPLSELSTELEDMSIAPDYSQRQGLSHEQVSQIARDALQDAREAQPHVSEEPDLFSHLTPDNQVD